ncbi:hypothetical protein ACFQ6V_25855 [Streptomyces roseifaciens]
MFDLKAEADMRMFSDRLAADLARLKRGKEGEETEEAGGETEETSGEAEEAKGDDDTAPSADTPPPVPDEPQETPEPPELQEPGDDGDGHTPEEGGAR